MKKPKYIIGIRHYEPGLKSHIWVDDKFISPPWAYPRAKYKRLCNQDNQRSTFADLIKRSDNLCERCKKIAKRRNLYPKLIASTLK